LVMYSLPAASTGKALKEGLGIAIGLYDRSLVVSRRTPRASSTGRRSVHVFPLLSMGIGAES
jgi:hypothetical protein